ncbi:MULTISPECIES: SDR family oxidoreductase [Streptomyces]|uniref:SDR family oxidoreductase n=1 Tax=Streptomyces caniscabiei TaxID=2746961 RepID=A0ABU4MTP6_9ACTN|nr:MULTISPECIES: SDR family oxidoreductase [Streptomyces]MBE4734656.1 SDR family oxidoreductase [Streptomyces caniscabiei]MBE4755527.1 SDR family oxidoreductase [Streptomyces caniscabiei]MBE4772349.1 SDR family oxidoreductase [Streptomyces caniscabiei]MBE4783189.1 SDR family oxidoreductase [Streptomyces caniscabiei]MBE4792493.1 SDR family oxidoreductase [Streptomyces caniscabiei]
MSLNGKVAIVTGASRGIGRATAERLGREGAAVVVNYQNNAEAAEETVKAITGAGGKAVAVQADVSVAADVAALYDTAVKEFGGVDIVVNNAATVAAAPVEYISEEDFDRLVATNLKSVFLSHQQATKHLRDGGRVVNLSAGLPSGAIAFLGAYGATKVGVEVLTRSLAHALGERGITVNAVAPGPTDTDMLAPEARANLDTLIAQTPLRKLGQPGDIADVVAFLAGEDGRWLTGQTIHANGGFA